MKILAIDKNGYSPLMLKEFCLLIKLNGLKELPLLFLMKKLILKKALLLMKYL